MGGPADQIIYVPENQLTQFKEALNRFTTYDQKSLNRQSLHHMHCHKGLRGQLVYFHNCVCNANTEHEWNPFYKIVGREKAKQKLSERERWGTYWFDEKNTHTCIYAHTHKKYGGCPKWDVVVKQNKKKRAVHSSVGQR